MQEEKGLRFRCVRKDTEDVYIVSGFCTLMITEGGTEDALPAFFL